MWGLWGVGVMGLRGLGLKNMSKYRQNDKKFIFSHFRDTKLKFNSFQ